MQVHQAKQQILFMHHNSGVKYDEKLPTLHIIQVALQPFLKLQL
nr:hypothetical protein [Sulfurimonas sp. SAG-AH-194-I05]